LFVCLFVFVLVLFLLFASFIFIWPLSFHTQLTRSSEIRDVDMARGS
jgi:hypothetical protein